MIDQWPSWLPNATDVWPDYRTVNVLRALDRINDLIADDPNPYTHAYTVKAKWWQLSDAELGALHQAYTAKNCVVTPIVDQSFTVKLSRDLLQQ